MLGFRVVVGSHAVVGRMRGFASPLTVIGSDRIGSTRRYHPTSRAYQPSSRSALDQDNLDVTSLTQASDLLNLLDEIAVVAPTNFWPSINRAIRQFQIPLYP